MMQLEVCQVLCYNIPSETLRMGKSEISGGNSELQLITNDTNLPTVMIVMVALELTYAIKAVTFELMIFLFPFGGIC